LSQMHGQECAWRQLERIDVLIAADVSGSSSCVTNISTVE